MKIEGHGQAKILTPSRNQTLIPLLSLSGRGKIEIRDIEVLKN
jgi:hypothetical protein